MQGKEKIFLGISEGIDAFKAKIKLWMHQMESGKLAAFPALNYLFRRKILICAAFHESFLSTLVHLFLSWIDISFSQL